MLAVTVDLRINVSFRHPPNFIEIRKFQMHYPSSGASIAKYIASNATGEIVDSAATVRSQGSHGAADLTSRRTDQHTWLYHSIVGAAEQTADGRE